MVLQKYKIGLILNLVLKLQFLKIINNIERLLLIIIIFKISSSVGIKHNFSPKPIILDDQFYLAYYNIVQ